jgi:hypothetical protein
MSARTKLADVLPEHDASPGEFAWFIGHGYGLPDSHEVDKVVRHGGRSGTGLSVVIRPVGGGKPLRIHYERESDCWNQNRLRAQASADTRGLTRGKLINSQAAAMAMYEALCSMADNFEAAGVQGETWEWVEQLEHVAAQANGETNHYPSLLRLQRHEYSKRLLQDPPTDDRGHKLRPVPMLLVDAAGYRYVTARQMAVFLRHDLGVEGAGSDDQIVTRLKDIGGERLEVEQWDRPGRDREHHVRLVLYRLPEPEPYEDTEEAP